MLELTECSAGYGGADVLADVSLTAAPGRVTCVVGPSGCGKTTLLMLAAGLKPPRAGTVRLDGQVVRAGDRAVGLILQQYGLFPWFTVRANVELGLRIRGAAQAERRAAAAKEIEAAGLGGLEERFPRELSGGQQQRVAIARAFALQPRLLLMDEPFSALDALNREALQDLLLESARARDTAVLLVTHSIEEAAYLGSQVWVMAGLGDSPRVGLRAEPGAGRGDEPGTGQGFRRSIVGRVDNPRQGGSSFRRDPQMLRTCASVRALMENAV